MRFCQTADWHITTKTGYAQVRLDYLALNVSLLAEKGRKNKVDFFALLGDIFNVVNPPEEDRVYFATQVKKLIDVAPVYIIPGNHDGNEKLSAFSSLGELVHSDRLIIINKPTMKNMYGHKVCFLPYSSNLPKYILKIRNTDCDVLFSHFSLIGSKVSKDNFKLKSWIDSKLLSQFKYVGLGDIHKGQVIGGNCWYSGSPNRVNFGEQEEPKHFLIVDIDDKPTVKEVSTNDIEFIEIGIVNGFPDNIKLNDNFKYVVKIKYDKVSKQIAKDMGSKLSDESNVIDVKYEMIEENVDVKNEKKVDYRKSIQEILYDYLKQDKTLKIDDKKTNYKYTRQLWV